mgnify:CR=1 FL=1
MNLEYRLIKRMYKLLNKKYQSLQNAEFYKARWLNKTASIRSNLRSLASIRISTGFYRNINNKNNGQEAENHRKSNKDMLVLYKLCFTEPYD